MTQNTLVIVDFQRDFYDGAAGSLYVKGAEACVAPICQQIRSGKFGNVVLTLDWHTLADHSFQVNGGIWPIHCVQYSLGAAIHPDIMLALQETGIPYQVFIKGNCAEHEEYGAFETATPQGLCNFAQDSCVTIQPQADNAICGLAGDYCVKQTYLNMVKHGVKVTPFYPGIAWIGEVEEYER